jgi:hypothetical protein
MSPATPRDHAAAVDEVAIGARLTLDALERLTGGPIPGLRRRVADALLAAHRRGDDDHERVRAVLVIVRPELTPLQHIDEEAA